MLAVKVKRPVVPTNFSRRIVVSGILGGGLKLVMGKQVRAACLLTAGQAEGPFYPTEVLETDADMTTVSGGEARASGEAIEVVGLVQDGKCQPVGNCNLEIWQANSLGRYAHPSDSGNSQPLDTNFQGHARISTDYNGMYRFITIFPGSYPAGANWIRPPHIHFKVKSRNSSLTTQMYFAGSEHNKNDYLLNALGPEERNSLIVRFDRTRSDGIRTGKFNITLARP